ncbi:hypothetical protein KFK09_020971 [Dendrobium nobile]|uniref:Uncharacterized protein n=1 Tax=Dendrobium nobile TaxID=94219 RepID=A0A8T3ANF9_DENNO|nr:hypothetical protein KFK09_020971 [Dendrobium nobile]
MKANGEGRTVALSTAVVASDMNPPGSADARGKHRILAELKHLEQEARFLEIESHADPLLPITHGPANTTWDKWFEGPPDSRHCKCWIL